MSYPTEPDRTWRALRDYLTALAEDDPRLGQTVQVLPHFASDDAPVHLLPAICWGTVGELCHVDGVVEVETRAADEFVHRPGQLVIYADDSPFAPNGDWAYELRDDGATVGIPSGQVADAPADNPR